MRIWLALPVACLCIVVTILLRQPSAALAQDAETSPSAAATDAAEAPSSAPLATPVPVTSSQPAASEPLATYSLPFNWEGAATILSTEIENTASPLRLLAANGTFVVSYVPTETGNVIRILPEPGQEPGSPLLLTFGWSLDSDATNPSIPTSTIAAIHTEARVYSPPDGVRLAIREQAGDWTSASIAMQEIAWTPYTVTKQISADATTVQFVIEWKPTLDNAWMELRNLTVAIYPPDDEVMVAQLQPTDTPTPDLPPTPTPTETPQPEPTATPAPEWIVVTSTPTPESVFAAATQVAIATEWARVIGPATATPPNMVTATFTPTPTPTNTPIIVINTPTPANEATATYYARYELAVAVTTGTPTPYPEGAIVLTATDTPIPTVRPSNTPRPPTPTRTPTPIFVLLDDIATATPAPTEPMPEVLIGKILFLSPHLASNPRTPNAFVINPDGTGVGLLSRTTFYNRAEARDAWSADRRFYFYASREGQTAQGQLVQIFWDDNLYNSRRHQLTYFGAGTAWSPAVSPVNDEIVVFVSSESRNDEIWLGQRNNWPAVKLTQNEWEWDQHPSFSPDGNTIVFHSNRVTGTRQLWLMDADGKNQRQLTNFPFEAFDPVWVKYPDS